MASPEAILAQENNFDCSRTIDQSELSQAPNTGYFIQLADPFNNTHVRPSLFLISSVLYPN